MTEAEHRRAVHASLRRWREDRAAFAGIAVEGLLAAAAFVVGSR